MLPDPVPSAGVSGPSVGAGALIESMGSVRSRAGAALQEGGDLAREPARFDRLGDVARASGLLRPDLVPPHDMRRQGDDGGVARLPGVPPKTRRPEPLPA